MRKVERFNTTIAPALRAARVPGAALAVVAGSKVAMEWSYGFRDLDRNLSLTTDTVYPIASTTKALNATILGVLVDEGKLSWGTSVRDHIPHFRLRHPCACADVTLRDLITMRTGLPRHDWLWMGSEISRAELAIRLRYLDVAAGFREKFQYNNLTVTVAGHLAEIVTGQQWEELVRRRLLDCLHMSSTTTSRPETANITVSYHENSHRELVVTEPLPGVATAPSGGAMYSTVKDMARWMIFNLNRGRANGLSLIAESTLAEVHSPQIVAGSDPTAPGPNAAYAMGWFVDLYSGHLRLSHSGYHDDVNSHLMLFPELGIGVVSFINFGPPTLARFVNQVAFDLFMGFTPNSSIEEQSAAYERRIEQNRLRISSMRRAENTAPSHPLENYAGTYSHPGYGAIEIQSSEGSLIFRRNSLTLPLEHWHYDAWIFALTDRFQIHKPHPFDRASKVAFQTSTDGEIESLCIGLEPAVAPIRFQKAPRLAP